MIRSDTPNKVNGRAEFGMDLEAPNMLWGALVPAPVAHGKIRSLDLSKARAVPGVVAVVGPKELRKLLPSSGGDPDRPVFPSEEILYRNQPIAAVAATSLAQARKGVRAVKVDIEPLPVFPDIESVFPDWPETKGPRSPHVIAHVHARHGDLKG
ncbi:MAG TPA: hypothetical protein VJS68_01710, partial [Thermoplasmata archaeon]|nr:hypothetical protein [Thermoplasmata archaeon]